MREVAMAIRAPMGDLRTLVRYPDDVDDLVTGLVLVDGAGEGSVIEQERCRLGCSVDHDPEAMAAVFPGADHGLYITDDDTLPLADRLAPGFLPMLQAWLRAH
jgi:hypothetical protein